MLLKLVKLKYNTYEDHVVFYTISKCIVFDRSTSHHNIFCEIESSPFLRDFSAMCLIEDRLKSRYDIGNQYNESL